MPTIPNSRTYRWLALALVGFAIYVSLIPLDWQPVPMSAAWVDFWSSITSPDQRLSRTNFLANVLLFVPLGFFLMGTMLIDRRFSLVRFAAALALTATGSLLASGTAEFLQVFTPRRVPSGLDILAQSIGTLFGVATWVVTGRRFTSWVRTLVGARQQDRLVRLLGAYVAVWLFVNLAPFDITVDVGVLARRFRTGDIVLVPFGAPTGAAKQTWDVLAAVLSAIPLGLFGVARVLPYARGREAANGFLIGAFFVVLMEAAHVFIRSHSADITDVIFGCIGVYIGIRVAPRVLSVAGGTEVPRSAGIPVWPVAAFVAWCFVLMAYHWQPYDFAVDSDDVRRKLARMSLVPFSGYRGSDLNAFNDVLVKLGLAMPLGVAAALVMRRVHIRSAWFTAGWVALAAVVFALVELGQFFLPTRIPDPTDVLMGIAGACAGIALGRWVDWDRSSGRTRHDRAGADSASDYPLV
jgi:glycopeptide antibiotics resistance protein